MVDKVEKLKQVVGSPMPPEEEKHPLEKLLESEDEKLHLDILRTEAETLRLKREAERVKAEKELEEAKKREKKEEAEPQAKPQAILDFSSMDPAAARSFLDNMSVDNLVKFALISNPRLMQEPAAVLLLAGSMNRPQESPEESVYRMLLEQNKQLAEAQLQLAVQQKEFLAKKELAEVDKKVLDLEHKLELAGAGKPKTVSEMIREITSFYSEIQKVPGLLGGEEAKKAATEASKWDSLGKLVETLGNKLPPSVWENIGRGIASISMLAQGAVAKMQAPAVPQGLVQQAAPVPQVQQPAVIPAAPAQAQPTQVQAAQAPTQVKSLEREKFEKALAQSNGVLTCDNCGGQFSVLVGGQLPPSGSVITCPLCLQRKDALGNPYREAARWVVP